MNKRVLLVASTTGYQVHSFGEAAERLGIDLVHATDRCHVLDNPWGDDAIALRFEHPDAEAIAARGSFDGILAVGDQPALVAAQVAEQLGLRFSAPAAVFAARNKFLARTRFRDAGLLVPQFGLIGDPHEAASSASYPCVLKPTMLSASRGVIRADNPRQFEENYIRIKRIVERESDRSIQWESFIPGREFALEGVITGGRLQVLALFDKPDPLDGPFFEETIYLTPSREPDDVQGAIVDVAQRAVSALGLIHGPVHAEMRVNDSGVWMLEAAARPIGGLCSRVLRFDGRGVHRLKPVPRPAPFVAQAKEAAEKGDRQPFFAIGGDEKAGRYDGEKRCQSPFSAASLACDHSSVTLEEILLLHATGDDLSGLTLSPGAHGVMMIPIPSAGVFAGVDGVDDARAVPGIEDVVITAKEGQMMVPLPEATSYAGFIFARADGSQKVERALRDAHLRLRFELVPALTVVR